MKNKKPSNYVALAKKQFKYSCFALATFVLFFGLILIANDFTVKFPNYLNPVGLYFLSLGLCLGWVSSIIVWAIKVIFWHICADKTTSNSTKEAISEIDKASIEYLDGVFNVIKKAKDLK